MTTQLTTAESFKAYFSSLGKELAKRGHKVPHQVLLDCASAASQMHSWNHLSAALKSVTSAQVPPAPSDEPKFLPSAYDLFPARLARSLNLSRQPLPRSPLGIAAAEGLLAEEFLEFALELPNGVRKELFWNPIKGNYLTDAPALLTFTVTCPCFPQMKPFKTTFDEVDDKARLEHGFAYRVKAALSHCLMPEIETFGLPYSGPVVRGEHHSDDHCANASFDARPFLAKLTDEELRAVWSVGLSGDYCTDGIADAVFMELPSVESQEVFDYLSACDAVGKEMGFNCSMNSSDFIAWISSERPSLFADLLCEQESVEYVERNGKFSYLVKLNGDVLEGGVFDTPHEATSAACLALKTAGIELEASF